METHSRFSPRFTALATLAAAVAYGVAGTIMVTHQQSSESTTVGIEHVTLAGMSLMLVLLVPLTLWLGRVAGTPRAATVAATGQVALSLLTLSSNILGEDASFFAAVAVPANLLWLGGWVTLAVALKRSGRVPAAVAVLLPVAWILALPLAPMGGAIAAAAYFATVGWLLRNGELERAPRRPAVA